MLAVPHPSQSTFHAMPPTRLPSLFCVESKSASDSDYALLDQTYGDNLRVSAVALLAKVALAKDSRLGEFLLRTLT